MAAGHVNDNALQSESANRFVQRRFSMKEENKP